MERSRTALLVSYLAVCLSALAGVPAETRAAGEVKPPTSGSSPSISADGRFVAFESLPVGDSNGMRDIYVRDLRTGSTTLVSKAPGPAGAPGDRNSFAPSISADGRFVAFESYATNLSSADDDRAEDVFVHDLRTGRATLVSRATGAAGAPGNGQSGIASISADGLRVAFASEAGNLSRADRDETSDVFVRDLRTNRTTLVRPGRGPNWEWASQPSLSPDGNFVALTVDTEHGPGPWGIFVVDLRTGTSRLADRPTGRGRALGGASIDPSIAAGGRFVAFDSDDHLSRADDDNVADVFVRDFRTATTTLVSRASGARGRVGDDESGDPAISADGRRVAFESLAWSLSPAVEREEIDSTHVYVRDLRSRRTLLVSRAAGERGAPADGSSDNPTISADGRYVAFESFARNLVLADRRGDVDVYVRDLRTGTLMLVTGRGRPRA